jgi:hypothetical protein
MLRAGKKDRSCAGSRTGARTDCRPFAAIRGRSDRRTRRCTGRDLNGVAFRGIRAFARDRFCANGNVLTVGGLNPCEDDHEPRRSSSFSRWLNFDDFAFSMRSAFCNDEAAGYQGIVESDGECITRFVAVAR